MSVSDRSSSDGPHKSSSILPLTGILFKDNLALVQQYSLRSVPVTCRHGHYKTPVAQLSIHYSHTAQTVGVMRRQGCGEVTDAGYKCLITVQVESLKYGVQWFKMKSDKQLIPKSSRQWVVEKNQTSSLVISEVTLEDSGWYYCEVNVLQKDPEWGNGTELVVLAPPSAPKIYLQTPSDPQTGQWALFCLTGGFHPSELTLTWTYQSEAANIDHLSVTNCTLPVFNPHGYLSKHQAEGALLSSDWLLDFMPTSHLKCFQVMDNHSRKAYLFSVFLLPQKESLKAGITFTCGVQDHPAMTTALTASFTWGN
ncbi:hypothetical protein ABVT39_025792 [Epinephelus coioides]